MLSELEQQGSMLKLRPQKLYFQREAVKHARGVITGFSRKSRGRLIEKMARLDTSRARTVFLTLTFAGTPEETEAKRAFQQFRMRLQRLFPRMSAMWRKEYQERGAIHFHLICFNMPYWKQTAIQRSWEECTREAKSIVHVKLLRHSKQAMYYVSKYIAKLPSREETTSLVYVPYLNKPQTLETGRHWGYIQQSRLPFAILRRAFLLDTEIIRYLRFTIRSLSRGKAAKGGGTTKLYNEEVKAIFERAVELGGMYAATDNFDSYGAVLGGLHPSSHLASLYAVRGATYNHESETKRAYGILERRWLDNQRLSRWWGRGSNKKRGTFAKVIFPR